jgi:oligoendopeptidase F
MLLQRVRPHSKSRRSGRRSLFSPSTTIVGALAMLVAALVATGVGSAQATDLPAYEPDANAERSQIPDVYKWDLTPLFPDDAAWTQSMHALSEETKKLGDFQGKLSDPKALADCLDLYFRLHDGINHVTLYANLQSNTDTADDRLQAMQTESLGVMDDLMRQAGFIRTEVLALSDAQMDAAYAAEPRLAKNRSYLENLRRRRSRILDPEAERVLALAGDNLWAEIDLNEIPSSLEDAFGAILTDIQWPMVHDEDGKEIQMTLANYARLRASKDREVRREAVTAFLATLRQFQHALAATLAGQYELDVTYARARHYDTALEAYLDKDDLDTAIYDNLIRTVNANLEPLHQYVELRKRVLGYTDVHLYDLYTPLVSDVDKDIPFIEGQQTVLKALAPMGDTYCGILRTGIDPENGWIDLYPCRNKRSGAFSASVYGRHPYVLMNYQNTLDDMFTLAHEFGHSIHSQLAMDAQPYSSYRYPPFLAEIASTCAEALLNDYLIAQAKDPAEKAYLLTKRLEGIRGTIYRQTLFAEFERKVHGFVEAGTPVTATLLDKTYADLIHRYYGPGYTVDENDGMEWAYIPHFYYKYYVFNYATGLSSGIAIAQRVRGSDGAAAAQGMISMLQGGCSEPPLDLLKRAGVDLTQPAPIESALQLFAKTLEELQRLLGT